MLDKINAIEARYNEINQLIEQNVDDYAKTNELMKERSDIEEIVRKAKENPDESDAVYADGLRQFPDSHKLMWWWLMSTRDGSLAVDAQTSRCWLMATLAGHSPGPSMKLSAFGGVRLTSGV